MSAGGAIDDIDLAGLLCARLCHDLISPVGAIGNGVELLRAEPSAGAEELALIEDSARAAQAALAFFRIAFGSAATGGQPMSPGEIAAVATAHLASARLTVVAPRDGDALPRPASRLLLLMLLAAASAAPLGGVIAAAPPQSHPLRLSVRAEGRRAGLSDAAAALICGDESAAPGAREAHFALLARVAASQGVRLAVTRGEDAVEIATRP